MLAVDLVEQYALLLGYGRQVALDLFEGYVVERIDERSDEGRVCPQATLVVGVGKDADE